MLRILTIACDFNAGGLQRVARNFALGYRRYGIESAYFGYQGGGPIAQHLSLHGVETFVGALDELGQQQAFDHALAWRPDVIHIHRDGPADARLSGMLRLAKASVRPGTSAPVGVVETNVFGRVDYSRDRACVDIHYLLSRWCLWKWERWSRMLSPRPIGMVMPNLVMREEFVPRSCASRRAFRSAHGIPADALVFGRVGSPFEPKWSPIIFSAFARYSASHDGAWLLLIGMPPDLRPDLMTLPAEIARRVVTIGFIHDDSALCDAYAAMDVFLHASRIGESFGMVLAEALLCGVPVITLGTPDKDNSQLEVVGHEVGGFVVTDVTSMVEAMRRLEAPELRHQYAKNGAAEITRRFSAESLIPVAIEVAQLTSEGLSPQELRQRVLSIPHLCTHVSDEYISALMHQRIGRYGPMKLAAMKLVSNPRFYQAYRLAMSKPV